MHIGMINTNYVIFGTTFIFLHIIEFLTLFLFVFFDDKKIYL